MADPVERGGVSEEGRVRGGHDVRVRGGITYQGSGEQLSTGTAECFEPGCDWTGPERVGDPDEAHEDAEQHRQETDSHVDCPVCDGSGCVPRGQRTALLERVEAAEAHARALEAGLKTTQGYWVEAEAAQARAEEEARGLREALEPFAQVLVENETTVAEEMEEYELDPEGAYFSCLSDYVPLSAFQAARAALHSQGSEGSAG